MLERAVITGFAALRSQILLKANNFQGHLPAENRNTAGVGLPAEKVPQPHTRTDKRKRLRRCGIQ